MARPGRQWPRALAAATTLAVASAAPRMAATQEAAHETGTGHSLASPFMPIDDPAYRYVDALLARGALPGLSALERPYSVEQLRRAVAAGRTGRVGDVPIAWARRLGAALDRLAPRAASHGDTSGIGDTGDAAAVRISLFAVGTAETSARRELMLADDSGGLHPGLGGRAALAAGPVVAVVRILGDGRLKDDPDFRGSKARAITGRTEEAYVAGHWRYGSLFLGRTARSWGPWAADGLQLGAYAYSWDHVAGTLGTDRLRLTTIVARLDRYRAAPDTVFERHVAMHRLSGRLGPVEIGVSEAVVYGGAGRGTELAYANPLSLYQLAQYNETADGNVSYAADVAWRAGRAGVLMAQLLVDDLQVDRCSPGCEEPASLGWTVSAEGIPGIGDQRLFASYTRVDNLTYRAPSAWERWSSFDVGLGRGFSDYDEARLGLDLAVLEAAPLRAYVAHRRQGEGDYRLPFPPAAEYPTTRAFLAGRASRTWRAALAGGMVLGPLDLNADVGFNRTSNADHQAGRVRSGVVGRVRATIRLDSPPLRL